MKPVSQNIKFKELEERTLMFWKEQGIFHKTLAEKRPGDSESREPYVFYDGPPFATGLPHYGHLLAGTIKDVVGRFYTMKGFVVDRRCGWDCHGMPVEFEIQKKLNLHGNKAIKEFGIDKFNEACREIVLRYTAEWQEFLERSGRWVDFKRQYRTMDIEYMESIWWVVKSLWDRGLIYEGLKCVPYSWSMNTPLSNFEANLNYKNAQDPAVTVKFKLSSKLPECISSEISECFIFIWTTTPWTVPSNVAVAVGKDLDYVLAKRASTGEHFIVCRERLEFSLPKGEESEIISEFKGEKLLGLEYEPAFDYFKNEAGDNAYKVYAADYVTSEDGTGIVHLASFGEEDLKIIQENDIAIIDPVEDDGSFSEKVPDFAGLNVKDADSKIIAHLKNSSHLINHQTIEHSVPFCWRTDKPLIYKSISTWFVKVESFKDELGAMNSLIHWVPEHLREGRMGNWLDGARDWAISRNRFWGTPLPVWRCKECDNIECLGSVQELEEKGNTKIEDLHRHFVDDISYKCSKCQGDMKRIEEVLDCWFESGSMPYAQLHYPFENKEHFEKNFPADFIAEGLDQTRGWFYTLLILSTSLFGRPAFKNVIVNGILLAKDGKKMSKSLKNYPPPEDVMDESGADAMRLYLLSSAATRGEELRFSEEGLKQVVKQTLLPLWNSYNFFVTYALADNWSLDNKPKEPSSNVLDRWILSKVASLSDRVDSAMTAYHLYATLRPVLDFVDQLTNWYIRLNRRRFWSGQTESEKLDRAHAYTTLHSVLCHFTRVLAPLAPFISEEIYLNLTKGLDGAEESVHLSSFPDKSELDGVQIDARLEHSMELFEEVIILGRGLRNSLGLKVRQPLLSMEIIHPEEDKLEGLQIFNDYIKEELNLKSLNYSTKEEGVVDLKALLNTKALGKVLGPKLGSGGMKELRNTVQSMTTEQIRDFEKTESYDFKDVTLGEGDIIIQRAAISGADNIASSGQITVVLETTLTPELRLEGYAREFVNRVQKYRKEYDFDVSDRIKLKFLTACPQISMALSEHADYVQKETLTLELIEVRDKTALDDAQEEERLVSEEINGKIVLISAEKIGAQ